MGGRSDSKAAYFDKLKALVRLSILGYAAAFLDHDANFIIFFLLA